MPTLHKAADRICAALEDKGPEVALGLAAGFLESAPVRRALAGLFTAAS